MQHNWVVKFSFSWQANKKARYQKSGSLAQANSTCGPGRSGSVRGLGTAGVEQRSNVCAAQHLVFKNKTIKSIFWDCTHYTSSKPGSAIQGLNFTRLSTRCETHIMRSSGISITQLQLSRHPNVHRIHGPVSLVCINSGNFLWGNWNVSRSAMISLSLSNELEKEELFPWMPIYKLRILSLKCMWRGFYVSWWC